jgi:hypothetical protein
MTSNKTIATLFRWSANNICGELAIFAVLDLGLALASRAMNEAQDEGQGVIDPAEKYYRDGVECVRLAIRRNDLTKKRKINLH